MGDHGVGERALYEAVGSGLADRSPDLVAAFGRDGGIRWCNDAGLELLGFERGEVIGRSIAEFLHPDDAARAIALALADVDHLRGAHAGAPYRHLCADGSYVILDVSVTVLDDVLVAVGRRVQDHEIMDRVLAGLTSGLPFEQVVALLPAFDLWRNPTAGCVIRCRDDDGEPLVVGSDLPPALSGAEPAPGSPWDRAVAGGAEVVDTDLSTLPAGLAARARAEGFGGCRVLAVEDPRGYEPALVTTFAAAAASPIEAHVYPMATIARTLALVLRFHHTTRELRHAAAHDPLTGLLHRGGFFAALPERLADTPVTVLAVDLDGFKQINDEFGHAAGDEVLRWCADRLRDVAGPDRIVARLGGDEFVVVELDSADRRAAEALATDIAASLARPVPVGGHEMQIGASVGVTVGATAPHDIDALLAEADDALYRAKHRSRRAPR